MSLIFPENEIENLEFYIGLLQELVEAFRKDTSNIPQQLRDFFNEYIQLEDKILSLISHLSQNIKLNAENQTFSSLINTFNIYWGVLQDQWSDQEWEIYNSIRTNTTENVQHHEQCDSILPSEKSFTEYLTKLQENDEKFSHNTSKHLIRLKSSTTITEFEESKSSPLINLQKIDEEMENVEKIPFYLNLQSNLSHTLTKQKRRNCIECAIF
jgi:hypothetical protein